MPYKIVQHGHKFSVVAQNTGHVAGTHPSKAKAQAQMAALYANEPEARKSLFAGGDGFSVEFNTPDCQHGWAVLKNGTGQSIGCYKTKEEAEETLKGLDTEKTDILEDEVRTTKTPEEYKINKTSIWDGVFVPADKGQMGTEFNSQDQDARYYFPSKAAYENDGKPNVGYGNRS